MREMGICRFHRAEVFLKFRGKMKSKRCGVIREYIYIYIIIQGTIKGRIIHFPFESLKMNNLFLF